MDSFIVGEARAKVLVVGVAETAAVVRSALSASCTCELVSTRDEALELLGRGHVDVVVVGYTFERWRELVDAMRARDSAVPLILLGAVGDHRSETDPGLDGVFDYVKAEDGFALARAVERAAAARRHRTDEALVGPTKRSATIIGSSPRFVETLASIGRVAGSTAPVLLVGETGTGKDLLAARIHALGPRSNRSFVVVNAAALPATLLDSELFGHSAGAFTGATRPRRGLISEADGGTLFLDEIADLPIELQGRLLRVIETGAIRPVGSDHERTVDVRFIAATHEPLTVAVAQKRFREDLFYRLNILSVRVPALRERREDIPALVDHFFARARSRTPQSAATEISPEAIQRLVRAPWPGNVRELSAVIERLVVFAQHARIEAVDLDALDMGDMGDTNDTSSERADGTVPTLRELSLRHVENVLVKTHGDKGSAAGILGIDVSTLYRWKRKETA